MEKKQKKSGYFLAFENDFLIKIRGSIKFKKLLCIINPNRKEDNYGSK